MIVVVRSAKVDEIAAIRAIEIEADTRFASVGRASLATSEPIPEDVARRAIGEGRLRVAEVVGEVVGWVYAARIDGELAIGQISVATSVERCGVGTKLLMAVIDEAKRHGERSIVLNTERDVPWNAPWYARHGFVEILRGDWSPALREIAEVQARGGLDWGTRVHMRLMLQAPT